MEFERIACGYLYMAIFSRKGCHIRDFGGDPYMYMSARR